MEPNPLPQAWDESYELAPPIAAPNASLEGPCGVQLEWAEIDSKGAQTNVPAPTEFLGHRSQLPAHKALVICMKENIVILWPYLLEGLRVHRQTRRDRHLEAPAPLA